MDVTYSSPVTITDVLTILPADIDGKACLVLGFDEFGLVKDEIDLVGDGIDQVLAAIVCHVLALLLIDAFDTAN